MEKGFLSGMVIIACTDMMFSVVTFIGAATYSPYPVYSEISIAYIYTRYSSYILNTLIKLSMGFYSVVCLIRLYSILHPFEARDIVRCRHTIIPFTALFIIWFCLDIPLIFEHESISLNCSERKIFMLSDGVFSSNVQLRTFFVWIWFLLGVCSPTLIIIICNIGLIINVTCSQNTDVLPGHATQSYKCMTISLIALSISTFVTVLPSEILYLYTEHQDAISGSLDAATSITNTLQLLNISCNIIFYCMHNSYFRLTIFTWYNMLKACMLCRKTNENNNIMLSPVRNDL